MNKFTFNHDFEKPIQIDPNAPKYTEDDAALIKEAAYAEGVAEGRAIQQTVIEADLTRAMEGFEDKLIRFAEEEATKRHLVQSEAAHLAKAVAMKICLADVEKHSVDRVLSCMEKVTKTLLGKPTMAIHVNPKIAKTLMERVQDLIQNGQIIIQADDSLEPMDCTFSWASGGAEVLLKNTLDEIERLIGEISQTKELDHE
ncbi:MAG: hypothetical protein KF798_05105 [Candidatus Paracaedibacteraceae bacterium]|nr:hypothetical protein [Candidatus Paracaedibacteraceae bacterium]